MQRYAAHANAPSFDVVVFFHLQEFGYKGPKFDLGFETGSGACMMTIERRLG